jgi:putative colanic acid biosynthesis UDP-glucose lipid carrier transferase
MLKKLPNGSGVRRASLTMNFVARRIAALVETPVNLSEARPRRKWPFSYDSIETLAIVADIAAIFLSSTVAGVMYQFETVGTSGFILQYIASAAAVSALFVSLTIGRGLYDPAELLDISGQIRSVTAVWGGVFLFCAAVLFALKAGADFSRGSALLFAFAGLGILLLQRIFWYSMLRRGLAGHRFQGRNSLLISDGLPGSGFVASLHKHGYDLKQQFVLAAEGVDVAVDEEVSQIVSYLRESPEVEEVLVTAELDHCTKLIKRLAPLRNLPITVTYVPSEAGLKILTRPSRRLGEAMCIELQRKPLNAFELALKRVIDIVFAATALIVLSPLLILIAVAIKLDSAGPVLFRQQRRGFNGQQFCILKFRTMSVLEDGQSILQATPDDRRITRLGKLLRRVSIDELPQLWNALTGSMSLVGPRPHALAHDNEFDKIVGHYAVRNHVKPGLTGWAQVHGCRGATPTIADVKRRVDLDLWYIDNWSFQLDCLIILRTVFEVVRGRNAY